MALRVGIIGGGIVGLATAYKLSLKYPSAEIKVLEKESRIATHQTGRNSGVIHSGIYYKPGSLKAKTCRSGKAQLEAFSEENGVKFDRCGKVVVALNSAEVETLHGILERGQQNGVDCHLISVDELKDLEPSVNGIGAVRVPETGIIDYVGFCKKLAEILVASGNSIVTGAQVTQIRRSDQNVVVSSAAGEFEFDFLVNCAGLYSDTIARMAGHKVDVQIVPFRGEYFELTPEAEHLCRNLIYPVPDIKFPFLGVHFTRMVNGGVECGPNAVLAFAREGYSNTSVNLGELGATLMYPGFQKMAAKHWKMGLGEMHRSFSKDAFVKALQVLIPTVEAKHLVKAEAGVRAQAIGRDGKLVDDFAFAEDSRCVHVLNAPSPAATACLAIADHIVGMLESRFEVVSPAALG